jgi:hypothetical protein
MLKFWSFIGGRKFLVLVLATGLCFVGKVESLHWVIVACAYIGLNVVQDWILKGKG